MHSKCRRSFDATGVAALLVALLLVSGCAGQGARADDPTDSSEQTHSAPTPDPCTILTTDDVSAAFGQNVTASGAGEPGGLGGRTCHWSAPDGQVSLVVLTDAGLAASEDLPAGFTVASYAGHYPEIGETVPGLGERSMFNAVPAGANLMVQSGGTMIILVFVHASRPPESDMVALAHRALDKIASD
jgi:hypothetical protein